MKIVEFRNRYNFKQKDLAKYTKISRSAIARFEVKEKKGEPIPRSYRYEEVKRFMKFYSDSFATRDEAIRTYQKNQGFYNFQFTPYKRPSFWQRLSFLFKGK